MTPDESPPTLTPGTGTYASGTTVTLSAPPGAAAGWARGALPPAGAPRTGRAAEQNGQRVSTSGHTELSQLAFGPLSATKASDLQQGLAKLVWKVDHRGKFDAPSKRLALEQLALTLGKTKLALTGVPPL